MNPSLLQSFFTPRILEHLYFIHSIEEYMNPSLLQSFFTPRILEHLYLILCIEEGVKETVVVILM